MGYYTEDLKATFCERLKLGYLKNKNGKTCNPTIYAHGKLDLSNNTMSDLSYSVSAYEDKNTLGYCQDVFDDYSQALDKYNEIMKLHVE